MISAAMVIGLVLIRLCISAACYAETTRLEGLGQKLTPESLMGNHFLWAITPQIDFELIGQ